MNKKAITLLILIVAVTIVIYIFWDDIKKHIVTKKMSNFSGNDAQEEAEEKEKEYEKKLLVSETEKEASNMMFDRSKTLSRDINSSADKLLVDFYNNASKKMNNESLSPLTTLIRNNEEKSYIRQKEKQALRELEKRNR